jgi:hypothetical protein
MTIGCKAWSRRGGRTQKHGKHRAGTKDAVDLEESAVMIDDVAIETKALSVTSPSNAVRGSEP